MPPEPLVESEAPNLRAQAGAGGGAGSDVQQPQSTTGAQASIGSGLTILERLTQLATLEQWVCWRLEPNPDDPTKPKKVPYNPPTGAKARANNPDTWGSFTEAARALLRCPGRYAGLGFVFASGGGLVGVDFDGCRDRETGAVGPWVLAWVRRLATYTEVSQSGTGLHCVGRGTLPPGGRRHGHVEMYDSGRFFAMTGNLFPGAPLALTDCGDALAALHGEVFGHQEPAAPASPRVPASPALALADDELLRRALAARNGDKLRRLLGGDVSGYGGDDSAADMALCSVLAFWTQDEAQLDRLFRGSALYRPKWDERRGELTYGQRTISRAVEQTRGKATPGRQHSLAGRVWTAEVPA